MTGGILHSASGLMRRLLKQHNQRTSIVKAELVRLARGQGDHAAIAPALFALLLGLLPRTSDAEAQLGLVAAARLVLDERSSGLESAIMASGATRCLVHSLLDGSIAAVVAGAIERGDEHHAARLCGGLATIVGALARQACSRRDLDAIFAALRATNAAPRPEKPAAERARVLGAVTVLRALCDALRQVDDRSPRAYIAFRPTAAVHTLSGGGGAARCSVRIAVGRPPPAASKAPLNLLRAGVTFSAWIRIEDPRSVRRQRSSPGSPMPRVVLSPGGSMRERRSRRRSAGESELCVLARIDARTRASIYLRHGPAGTDLMVGISPSTAPPSPKRDARSATTARAARSKADVGLFGGLFGALLGDAAAPNDDTLEESELSTVSVFHVRTVIFPMRIVLTI